MGVHTDGVYKYIALSDVRMSSYTLVFMLVSRVYCTFLLCDYIGSLVSDHLCMSPALVPALTLLSSYRRACSRYVYVCRVLTTKPQNYKQVCLIWRKARASGVPKLRWPV